jgi:hypothetical protein
VLAAQRFRRAFAGIALPNDASVALHRSVGFTQVGTFREAGRKFGGWIDVAWYERAVSCAAGGPSEPIPLPELPGDVLSAALRPSGFDELTQRG